MLRVSHILLAILFLKSLAIGQTFKESATPYCGSAQANERVLNEDGERKLHWDRIETNYFQHVNNQQRSHNRSQHTLPIVIHIIHDGGDENIMDAKVLAGVDHLNLAFENSGYFDQGTGVNTDITFCLAKQDPDGNSTSGITRTRSALTNLTGEMDDVPLKDLVRWDPLHYINIWLVKSICRGTNCAVAGFAYYPMAHGLPYDGIVMEAEWLGSTEANSTVLVHEMGHYLGLRHTFDGGCQNRDCLLDGDRVCDTPPDQNSSGDHCRLTDNSCFTDTDDVSTNNPFRPLALGGLGDQMDMKINYMDYSLWTCYSAFTAGQAARMDFFIHTSRNSLLSSTACDDPCPSPAEVAIDQNDLILNVGTTFTLSATTQQPGQLSWTINGLFESSALNFTYLFNTVGDYEIIFSVDQQNPLCAISRDTILIKVVCPVESGFLPLPSSCYAIDTTILFQSNSLNATTNDWYLENNFIGQGNAFSIAFNSFGRQRLTLISSNGICQDTFYHTIQIGCDEICDNGYDDDGDFLVDQYDPDCCGVDTTYNFLCDTACLPTDDFPYNIQVEWRSSYATSGLGSPLVGDIDGDGEEEVVMIIDPTTIVISDGQTGQEENRISGISFGSGLAIADVDNDGFGEIIAMSGGGFVYCYEHHGALKYTSAKRASTTSFDKAMYISIADFNQDGWAEILIGNQIFNGLNGAEIIPVTPNAKGQPYDEADGVWLKRATVAVDILPDNFCPNCEGLEIVAGNQVLSIDINNAAINVEVEVVSEKDGYTSVCDFDQDGDLDVITSNRWWDGAQLAFVQTIYVWDGQTNAILARSSESMNRGGNLGGLAAGNFDDDSDIELALISIHELYLLDHDLSVKWTFDLSEASAVNVLAFDFNLDGVLEIVVRDSRSLFIIDARTGTALYTFPMASTTITETLAIADVDGDQQAEIVVDGNNRLYTFGVDDIKTWANSRKVFNQALFFNVNINDDLSVPPQQQQHHMIGDKKTFNTFMNPVAIPRLYPDGIIEILGVKCAQDSLIIALEICNKRTTLLPAQTPIKIYCGDPFNLNVNSWDAGQIGADLKLNECVTKTITIESGCANTFFAVLNVDDRQPPFSVLDFPMTNIIECDYENNIDSFLFEYNLATLSLGPDTIICPGDPVSLNASNKYVTYEWSTGNTDSVITVSDGGIYWVIVTDSCGGQQRDSLVIDEFDAPKVQLGNDTTMCAGGVLELNAGDDFRSYRWSTGDRDSTITITEPGDYSVTVTDDCDVVSWDMIQVETYGVTPLDLDFDLRLCTGGSSMITVLGYDQYAWSPATYVSCDTCQTIVLSPPTTTTFYLNVLSQDGCHQSDSMVVVVDTIIHVYDSLMICEGDTLIKYDSLILSAGDYVFYQEGFSTCDSIVNFYVELNTENIIIYDTVFLCLGDSIILYDSLITEAGNYLFNRSSENGCDTTLSFIINIYEELFNSIDTVSICPGDTLKFFNTTIVDEGNYEFLLNSSTGCDSIVTIQVTMQELELDLNADTAVLVNSPVLLDLEIQNGNVQEIRWTPTDFLSCSTCPNPIATPSEPIVYNVEVIDNNGCETTATISIDILESGSIFIPKAFSPNDDGINDLFQVYTSVEAVVNYSMKVYNRWGGKVFETENLSSAERNHGWDGTFRGKEMDPGVFVYHIIASGSGEEVAVFSGSVVLLR